MQHIPQALLLKIRFYLLEETLMDRAASKVQKLVKEEQDQYPPI